MRGVCARFGAGDDAQSLHDLAVDYSRRDGLVFTPA